MNDMVISALSERVLRECLAETKKHSVPEYHCNYCGGKYTRPHDCATEIKRMNGHDVSDEDVYSIEYARSHPMDY